MNLSNPILYCLFSNLPWQQISEFHYSRWKGKKTQKTNQNQKTPDLKNPPHQNVACFYLISLLFQQKFPNLILQDLLNNSFSSTLPAALLMLWMSWYSVAELDMFAQKGLCTFSVSHGDNVALVLSCTNYLSAQHCWKWPFNLCLYCSCLVDDTLSGERTLPAPARLPPAPACPKSAASSPGQGQAGNQAGKSYYLGDFP